ncbi:NADP-dependent phosphogluconate dehydrogenase [Mucilaginibacter arboris]|uniref:6-phosphogluconate dehydrogenase, decarboxylating n=1 Tax=Mucilaginibacter arboris TaxID=2682090 RepID=A0A7K1SYD2_9SPHI|nr:NADP-dependent phosphogluconate dehydrogenase [Mucilaginibacter arboris]MVN22313.1 NADP-dependent phosphogluconate dehydrogenase [Mucilaginibacter arboris]
MPDTKYKFGMIGLGTMGRNLLLNMADHDFAGAGYDKNADQIALLEKEGDGTPVKGFTELHEFVQSLQTPRAIMMLVPAGKIVDSVIEELIPLLEKGDIVIDGGNSHFTDTNVRVDYLESKGLHFFGMGISGGEEGARKGPSMMPGGDKEAYNFVKPVLEAIAAKVDGQPCVTYIGPGASGHFVKMVHNGIEYAIMQLISETYGILKNGLGFDNDKIESVFSGWSKGKLQSFLMEITSDILKFKKPGSDHLLIDDIKDEARAKGTGKWTSQIAMDLETPIPSVDAAVSTRDLSKYKALRVELSELYADVQSKIKTENQDEFVKQLEDALYFSMITAYTQGMHLLFKASIAYNYKLNLGSIAQIWRGGCIIRSAFLEDIFQAYHKDDDLELLYTDANVQQKIKETLPAIRQVLASATVAGLALPAHAASLNYFDNFRTANMPSNLIQAQRDYFGAHTYELIGKEGVFHTVWTDVDKDKKEKP